MPLPDGTSRSHAATCGRSFTALAAMLTLADVRPGDAASIRMFPAFFCSQGIVVLQAALPAIKIIRLNKLTQFLSDCACRKHKHRTLSALYLVTPGSLASRPQL